MDDPEVPPLLGRPLGRGELIALDGLAAAGYAVVFFATAIAQPSPVAGWARALIAVGICGAVTVRRLWPLPVFGVVLLTSIVATVLDVVREPLVAAAFALYPVAVTRPRPQWEPTLAIGIVSVVGMLVVTIAGPSDENGELVSVLALGCAITGGTWTIGRAVRERRAFARRSAEQLAQHAADAERLRIARELHDVVSHTLSLIGVKARVANHVAESRPEEVRDALRVIAATSRTALTEMRHMLGLLRSDGAPADLQPSPRLVSLSEIAEQAAMAGVRVDLDVRGADELPHAVELAVHRIVQEAVTNVIKHAAPTRCQVTVAGRAGAVRVEVTDDGPGHRTLPGPPGHGLTGMRERVNVHSGTFTAGPRPEGGFVVSATLPYGPPDETA